MFLLRIAAQDTTNSFGDVAERASAARSENNYPEAIRLYRQALGVNPEWNQGWWSLGSVLDDTDQYAAARDALAEFVKRAPDAAPGWGLLGLSEFEIGDYNAALADIRRSLDKGADQLPEMSAVLRYHEAILLTRAGDFDAASKRFVWFARKGRPNTALLIAAGLAALRRPMLPRDIPAGGEDIFVTAGTVAFSIIAGDYAATNQAFDQLVTQFPAAAGVHLLYGTYLLTSAPEHALREFRRELEIAPDNATAATMLASALLNQRKPDAALPFAERAATALPTSATALYVLGRALVETGDTAHGIQKLEHAAKLDPASLDTHLALASAYSKTGHTAAARRERVRALELAHVANT